MDNDLCLSLVIPCYNEESNLRELIGKCDELVDTEPRIEIILVDNGSVDSTSKLLSHFSTGRPWLKTPKVDVNQGYGYGVLVGLNASTGSVLAWTHADLQTDPQDVLTGYKKYQISNSPETLFIKGRRSGRPLLDQLFTWGMSLFELIILNCRLNDIHGQPNICHRSFYESVKGNAPHDFSFDLFVYHEAVRRQLIIERFDVIFGPRLGGVGSNDKLKEKMKYSLRAIAFSIKLRRSIKTKQFK